MTRPINIDDLSLELTREIALENVEKALPPKLLYRFRRWMRMHGGRVPSAHLQHLVTEKFEEISNLANLQKNEAAVSMFDNGIVKMDFGSDVDPKVKDAALKWARRRGLTPVEASLNKSANIPQSFVFAADPDFAEYGRCKKRLRWLT
jgi:hypothetical protein